MNKMIKFDDLAILLEYYKEGKSSTVTHDGKEYSVDKIVIKALRHKRESIKTDYLKWMVEDFQPTKEDKERIDKVNLHAPIVIVKWKDKLVVLDGFHRLLKAIGENRQYISVKELTEKELDDCIA